MKYEWYIDVFFLFNFFMDASAMLFTAVCCNCKVSGAKIFLIAAAAVTVSTILLLFLPVWLLYVMLVHIVLNPWMTVLVFSPKSWKDFFTYLLMVYLFLVFAGGIQESLWLQFGLNSSVLILISGIVTMCLFALWQVRRRLTARICAVDLWLDGRRISVKAYYDSGNLLRHPITGKPVSIVDCSVFPEGWLAESEPAEKILFRTVSNEQAEIRVVTLDKMEVYLKGAVREITEPQIGLHTGTLMKETDVQMLLNEAVC